MRRNAKIVATYGPALAAPGRIEEAVLAGVDVFRLNLSYGDRESHRTAMAEIRRVAEALGHPCAVLVDLRGPKIRVGADLAEAIVLAPGEAVRLEPVGAPGAAGAPPASDEVTAAAAEESEATPPRRIPIDGHPTLAADLHAGEPVLLDDGRLRLRAGAATGEGIVCQVEVGGEVRPRQGVNLPKTDLQTLENPTAKDWRDLEFAIEEGADWIALSFVRRAEELERLRRRIREADADIPLIAKIEKQEALHRLDEIVAAADGIMVARGDLGVETELAEVTLRQKEIIRTCNRTGKVVITATQMLESMIERASPTRAEVADVSNAIFDGTDALMLSGETAIGAYPIEAIRFMASVAKYTESARETQLTLERRPYFSEVPDAVAHGACLTAHEVDAAALICLTRSGLTARLVSRYRPRCPVIAVSPHMTTVRRLALVWGVCAFHLPRDLEGDALVEGALDTARHAGWLETGEHVVLTAGVSPGPLRGKTNLIRVEVL